MWRGLHFYREQDTLSCQRMTPLWRWPVDAGVLRNASPPSYARDNQQGLLSPQGKSRLEAGRRHGPEPTLHTYWSKAKFFATFKKWYYFIFILSLHMEYIYEYYSAIKGNAVVNHTTTWTHLTKWKKPDPKGHMIQYHSIYMKYPALVHPQRQNAHWGLLGWEDGGGRGSNCFMGPGFPLRMRKTFWN